ncbi:MAG: M56 family metallopeptidase [Actinomycetota bacterium]|nr:M56 family metallopeptidase [Actinomycetota bacterium]
MTIALVLVLGALLVAWVAPRRLERRLRGATDPQITLVTWLALVSGTLLSVVVTAGLVLLPGHGPAQRVVTLVHHCWAAVAAGSFPRVDEVAGLLAILIAAVAVARGGAGVFRHLRQRRRLHRTHLDLLRILTGTAAAQGSMLWLDSPQPMAYSVAGRPSLVVATEGLRRSLPDNAVAAVLSHEQAHLRGKHHLLVGLAEALAAGLPWLPLMRRSPALVRALVEVSADASAARSHGATTVRAALLSMSAHGTPAHALGMAQDCLALRLDALSSHRPSRSRLRRALGSGVATAVGVALPTLASAALLAAAMVMSCPFRG